MSMGQMLGGCEGPLLTVRLTPSKAVVGKEGLADSLTAFVEQAVLTSDDYLTLPSITYDRPLSFQSITDEATVEVWSEAPGQLWVHGSNLGRIQVYTPDGLLVKATQGKGDEDHHLRSGLDCTWLTLNGWINPDSPESIDSISCHLSVFNGLPSLY
jgi:hypothetical protein